MPRKPRHMPTTTLPHRVLRAKSATSVVAAILLAGCGSHSGGGHARAARDSVPHLPQFAPTPSPLDETPKVVAGGVVSTHVPWMPSGIGAGFGAIWVESHRGNALYRIDPRTSRMTAVIAIPDSLCSVPRFGAGAVWVFTCNDGDTYKIDPATNAIVGKFRGHGQHSGPPIYGAGSLW